MISSDGASRMSSVFGLNASPQTAKRRPVEIRAEARDDLLDEPQLLRVVGRFDGVQDLQRHARARAAVCCSAFTSFGKHEPP